LSLTLTAMMWRLLLRAHEQPGGWPASFERGFAAMMSIYQRTLGWVMRHNRPLWR